MIGRFEFALMAGIDLTQGVLGLSFSLTALICWGNSDSYELWDDGAWYNNFWMVMLVLTLAQLPMGLMLFSGIYKRSPVLVVSHLVAKMVWILLALAGCLVLVVYVVMVAAGVTELPPESKFFARMLLKASLLLVLSALEARFWYVVYSNAADLMQQPGAAGKPTPVLQEVVDRTATGNPVGVQVDIA